MENGTKYLYIVFTSTPYKLGTLIRKVTHEKYNHISISLDQELTSMYSFARRYYRTPFYGGFVQETLSRYHVNDKSVKLQVCKIPVSDPVYERICKKLKDMVTNNNTYTYNYYSAVASLFKKRLPIDNAYTCVEFCVEILQLAGLPLDLQKYYAIGDLVKLLHPYRIYEKTIKTKCRCENQFFCRKPVPHPVLESVSSIYHLSVKMIK